MEMCIRSRECALFVVFCDVRDQKRLCDRVPVMVRFAHGSGRQPLRFGHVCAPAIHPIASFPIVLDWLLNGTHRARDR
jgi:hypothetical protein